MGSQTLAQIDVSLEGFSITDHEKCAICLGTICQVTSLESCGHRFCYQCIKTWAKNKRACPLCNAEFFVIRIDRDSGQFEEEIMPQPTAKQADLASDLECLDHSYFLGDAMRLLGIAQESQRCIARSQKQNANTKFGNRFTSSWEASKSESLHVIEMRLYNLVQLFRSDEHFDPHAVLQELYDTQFQMEQISRGPQAHQQEPTFAESCRYSSEDYDDLSSDSEDEYCYDFDGGRDCKKERKPTGRAPKHPVPHKKKK